MTLPPCDVCESDKPLVNGMAIGRICADCAKEVHLRGGFPPRAEIALEVRAEKAKPQ